MACWRNGQDVGLTLSCGYYLDRLLQCFSTVVPRNPGVPRTSSRGSGSATCPVKSKDNLGKRKKPRQITRVKHGNSQPLTCANLDFLPWLRSNTRSENDCYPLKKNFECICPKLVQELSCFAEIARRKFHTNVHPICLWLYDIAFVWTFFFWHLTCFSMVTKFNWNMFLDFAKCGLQDCNTGTRRNSKTFTLRLVV